MRRIDSRLADIRRPAEEPFMPEIVQPDPPPPGQQLQPPQPAHSEGESTQ
jgi:hypothetical protein